jgi:hypothetical protein
MQLTKFNRYIRTRMQLGINIHINVDFTIFNSIRNALFFSIRKYYTFINIIFTTKLR